MEDTTIESTSPELADPAIACPVCEGFAHGGLLPLRTLPDNLREIVSSNAASANADEVCARCLELFSRAQRQTETHAAVFEQNDSVLPTPLRMDADERFTGRGVTIAFLDSGFYAHPDLTQPNNRIVAYHSIFAEDGDETSLETNDVASWHGMMTSVVAAGNGGLAEGFYRGIASDAKLVLVKIGRTGRISESQIQKGLKWALANAAEYDLKVINISAG